MLKQIVTSVMIIILMLCTVNTPVAAAEAPHFYSAQVASFKNRNEAVEQVKVMSARGLDAFYHRVKIKEVNWYRVMIGKYDSRETAHNEMEELRKNKVIREYLIHRMNGLLPLIPVKKEQKADQIKLTRPVSTPLSIETETTAKEVEEMAKSPVDAETHMETLRQAPTQDEATPQTAMPTQTMPEISSAQPEATIAASPIQKKTREDILAYAKQDDRSADYYYFLGIAYDAKGEYDQAIDSYTKAIDKDPNYAAAYNKRGIIYIKRSQNELALADHKRAIDINPLNAEYYLSRGIDYRQTGRFEEALADFHSACKMGNEQGCDALRRMSEKFR
jgi:tetratricopeptide (TPR) repeat protein